MKHCKEHDIPFDEMGYCAVGCRGWELMEQQITTLISQLADAEEEIVGRGDSLADANRQIQELRSALEKYGEHEASCPKYKKKWGIIYDARLGHDIDKYDCTCGLDALKGGE